MLDRRSAEKDNCGGLIAVQLIDLRQIRYKQQQEQKLAFEADLILNLASKVPPEEQG